MAKPKTDVVRISATVPREVADVWREAAEAEGRSLSGLVAEWMGELVPGLRDTMRLRKAFEMAEESQKQQIRAAVASAGDAAQATLLNEWDVVRSAIDEVTD